MMNLVCVSFSVLSWLSGFPDSVMGSSNAKIAVGIDLGYKTKISVISSKRPKQIDYVTDEVSSSLIPSFVGMNGNKFVLGQKAFELWQKNETNSISIVQILQEHPDPWSSKLILNDQSYSLFSLAALYFSYLKSLCTEYLVKNLDSASNIDSSVVAVQF